MRGRTYCDSCIGHDSRAACRHVRGTRTPSSRRDGTGVSRAAISQCCSSTTLGYQIFVFGTRRLVCLRFLPVLGGAVVSAHRRGHMGCAGTCKCLGRSTVGYCFCSQPSLVAGYFGFARHRFSLYSYAQCCGISAGNGRSRLLHPLFRRSLGSGTYR